MPLLARRRPLVGKSRYSPKSDAPGTVARRREGLQGVGVALTYHPILPNQETSGTKTSTHKISLTEAGRVYLASCERVLEEVDDGRQAVEALCGEPRGRMRLSAPFAWSRSARHGLRFGWRAGPVARLASDAAVPTPPRVFPAPEPSAASGHERMAICTLASRLLREAPSFACIDMP